MDSGSAAQWLDRELDRAIAPYVGLLPAAELTWLRERLLERIVGDRALADRARAAVHLDPDESGVVPTLGAVIAEMTAEPAKARGARTARRGR